MTASAVPGIGRHYESVITLETGPHGERRVRKTYRLDAPSVQWLNRALASWYPADAGLPVAQHEMAALRRLSPFGIVPDPIALEPSSIVMGWAGEPISRRNAPPADRFESEARAILDALATAGVRHNDMLPRNVLVERGRLRLIDFTLAEFDEVRLMDTLPDPSWARPGGDAALLTFHDVAPDVDPSRWRHWIDRVTRRIRAHE